jgi:hypothetical protein
LRGSRGGRMSGSWRGRRSRGLGGDLRRRFCRCRRRGGCDFGSPHGRARHEQRRSLAVLARRDHGAIDLRLEQNVVGPADHDEMFHIVAPDEHKLALPVEAECVDQPEPGLAGPSARNTQPLSERQPVKNRQNDKGGDRASQKEADLQDPIVRERKVTQPLHAQSKSSAPGRDKPLFKFARQRRFRVRPRRNLARAPVSQLARRRRAPRIRSGRAHVTSITKRDPVENCGAPGAFAQVEPAAAKTSHAAHGSTRSTATRRVHMRPRRRQGPWG